jgi:hypothetical protein
MLTVILDSRCSISNVNSSSSYYKELHYIVDELEISLVSNTLKADLGKAGQKILISNTFFDPIMIEVEMVDQTVKTLSYGIYGNSTRDMEDGTFSIFDENNNLYKQYNLVTRKKQFSNGNVDYKQQKELSNIDYTKTFNDLSQQ